MEKKDFQKMIEALKTPANDSDISFAWELNKQELQSLLSQTRKEVIGEVREEISNLPSTMTFKQDVLDFLDHIIEGEKEIRRKI